MTNNKVSALACYFCYGENTVYINFHGEELYECRDCGRLTDMKGNRVKSVMEDI